ncbi:BRCT domain-containing protein [Flavobacterium tructae]|uniref:BRCT domain-containing protein n=1 Tax=Flavobacterium TaxID=237 RepID=UPI00201E78F4|nr:MULTISPECIES: BRCT domain-containing protein [Flavobacterium]MDL2145455.1 BRCT domain-containing protein [Flavobacterium tructae]URC12356.1 BRCT domain-containing protein [Flavobacterium sp. B183]
MSNIDQEMLKIYTSKSQADKAIGSLKGLLLGIQADGEVNEKEIIELRKWVSKHKQLVNRNPFNEFMTIIEETISNKIPPKETIEDLFWLCQKYESDSYYYNAVTTDLQILQGICHGILADGIITDKEIYDLQKWLNENEHLNTYYPYDEIRSLVLSVLSDNKINEEEKVVLMAFFKQFVQIQDDEVSQKIQDTTIDVNIFGLCTSEPEVIFEGKTFCITGVLQRGNRENLHRDIIKFGGIPTDSITKKTDYLIVGDNGNPAWAFSCYGRKVEKAINLRKEGHTIMLIHEFDFSDLIDDLL